MPQVLLDLPGRCQRRLHRWQHEGDGHALDREPGGRHPHQDALTGAGGGIENLQPSCQQLEQILRGNGVRGAQLPEQVRQDGVHVAVLGPVAPVDARGDLQQPGRGDRNLGLVGCGVHLGQLLSRGSPRPRCLAEQGNGRPALDQAGAGCVLRTGQPDARGRRRGRLAPRMVTAQPGQRPVDVLQQVPAHARHRSLGPLRVSGRRERDHGRLARGGLQQRARPGSEHPQQGQFLGCERHNPADPLPLLVRQTPPAPPLVQVTAEEERGVTEPRQHLAVVVCRGKIVGGQGQSRPDGTVTVRQLHAHTTPAFRHTSAPIPPAVAALRPNSPHTAPSSGRLDSR